MNVREPVLSVRDLVVEFATPDGVVHAVAGMDYDLYPGETLAIVGESGSGKSVSAMALLGLVPQPPGRIASGSARLRGRELLGLRGRELRQIRGREIAMVFQDPMTSLNPVLRIGEQIAEALAVHDPGGSAGERARRVVELLELVGVPDARERAAQYPHEYSGGMRQRAMIAMAMANRPAILVADEPTTALDVTIQAQVLDVLRAAQKETEAATILITHDLGVVAELADRVAVMYAGRIVEMADAETLFARPRHPYTLGLLASLPRLDRDQERLSPIPGQPPSLIDVPSGCPFHPRCRLSRGRERCRTELPPLYATDLPGQQAACHFWTEMEAHTAAVRAEVGAERREEAT
ncbi:MAG TPA: ABC transporter ATP-binding protein [Egibacteraceae bacterium]|nr:ABC transporter ATP-binding protein [Egibacteraceae bacterium]